MGALIPHGFLISLRLPAGIQSLKERHRIYAPHLWGRGPQLLSRSKFKAAEIISSISFLWRPHSMPCSCSSRTCELHGWVRTQTK